MPGTRRNDVALSSRLTTDKNNDSSAEYAYCCDFLMDELEVAAAAAASSSSSMTTTTNKTWEMNDAANGKRLSGMCDCVWNKGLCRRCSQYDSFKCHFCPMVFLKADVRNRHLRISHRKELLKHSVSYFRGLGLNDKTNADVVREAAATKKDEPPVPQYHCDKCGNAFGDKVALIEHLTVHRDAVQRPKTKKMERKRKFARRSRLPCLAAPAWYTCAHCSAIVRTKMDMKRHLMSSHEFKLDKRGGIRERRKPAEDEQTVMDMVRKSFKSTSASGQDEDLTIGYYTCAVCGLIFLKRHSFTRHVHQHSSCRYECDMCKKTFNSENVLLEHRKNKHKEIPKNVFFVNGRKYLKCELCSFTCRNERNKMEEHLRVHTGEKPFTCEQCGKQFRTRALLRVHRRYVHDGVKEHACDLCGRCFSNKRYMEEHRRIHTGEKPLICDLCGKTFRQNSSLSKHVENHMGIKRHACHLCEKRFSNSHHLSIHIRRHMGEASFVCNKCGKGFVDQYQLKNHQVVHSEERPFVCLVCGTRFKLPKHLKQHSKRHRTG